MESPPSVLTSPHPDAHGVEDGPFDHPGGQGPHRFQGRSTSPVAAATSASPSPRCAPDRGPRARPSWPDCASRRQPTLSTRALVTMTPMVVACRAPRRGVRPAGDGHAGLGQAGAAGPGFADGVDGQQGRDHQARHGGSRRRAQPARPSRSGPATCRWWPLSRRRAFRCRSPPCPVGPPQQAAYPSAAPGRRAGRPRRGQTAPCPPRWAPAPRRWGGRCRVPRTSGPPRRSRPVRTPIPR